jgi:hypothetical protein
MSTELREQIKNSAEVNIRIVHARQCQKIFGRKICTPEIRLRAYLRLSANLTNQLSQGVTAATPHIVKALAATGAAVPVAPASALIGALIAVGINMSRNSDGSLDLMIAPLGILLGPLRIPIPLPPPVVAIILNTL